MPSSLIVVALVVAWLVVLVPMIVRKRQEVARTADSALAARVVHSGEAEEEAEEDLMPDVEEIDDVPVDEAPFEEARRYRPGRGGYDPEAAAVIARAKYGFRQRVVLAMIVTAVLTAVFGGIVFPMLWYAHGAVDVTLISYLVYLRRQVRIEQEIRERRLARMRSAARVRAHQRPIMMDEEEEDPPAYRSLASEMPAPAPRMSHPGATPLDLDDEDPAFDDLDTPDNLRYRRASGE